MVDQSNLQRERKQRNLPSDHIGVILASMILMAVGWVGLAALIIRLEPSIGAELWLLFILLQAAVTGTSIPIIRYFNIRLTRITDPVPPGGVIVRQSVWVGLFVVICAWLQIQRGLSLPIAFFLGLVFVVLEVFLRARELNNVEYEEF
jgi:hypothetical protein